MPLAFIGRSVIARLDRRAASALACLMLFAACGSPPPSYDLTGPAVSVGPERSCHDLRLSDVRCTAIILRAAKTLDTARPGHAAVTGRALHAAGAVPAGASADPTTEVAAIVVFSLADGRHVAIPTICPKNGSTSDPVCNPLIQ